jgi:predicted nucleotidyltransferase
MLRYKAIINQGDYSKIQEPYGSVVNDIQCSLSKIIGDGDFCSFYVRGSVSVGLAKPPYSDVDVVVVLNSPPSQATSDRFRDLSDKLQKKYSPDISEIDITVTTVPRLLYSNEIKNLKVYLKYQSVLISGNDILDELPEVIPSAELATYMYNDLTREVDSLRRQFQRIENPKKYQGVERADTFWCVWLCRTILRSMMALCMEKSGIFTQDLRECAKIGMKYYPELKQIIELSLIYAINPTGDKTLLLDFVEQIELYYMLIWDKRGEHHG